LCVMREPPDHNGRLGWGDWALLILVGLALVGLAVQIAILF
jgi:hypothetical protein